MSISASDLLSPAGRLDPAVLWPGKSSSAVDLILSAYLSDADTRTVGFTVATDRDAARTKWVEYRAFDAAYQDMLTGPNAVAFADEGSGSRSVEQMRLLKDERDLALAEYEELVDELDAVLEDYSFLTRRSLRD